MVSAQLFQAIVSQCRLAIRVARGSGVGNGAVGGWISRGSVSGRPKLRERWRKAYTPYCIAPRLLRLAGDAKWELSRQPYFHDSRVVR